MKVVVAWMEGVGEPGKIWAKSSLGAAAFAGTIEPGEVEGIVGVLSSSQAHGQDYDGSLRTSSTTH